MMGMTIAAVPFWNENMKIGRIESASSLALFCLEGRTLADIPAQYNLWLRDDGCYEVAMPGREWFNFVPAP